jgi:phage/plasmid-associated DNA primase
VPKNARLFLWTQNDQPNENGQKPNDTWVDKSINNAGTADIYIVEIPPQYKDTNDWTRAGATTEDLLRAPKEAQPYSATQTREPIIEVQNSYFDQLEAQYHGPTIPNAKGYPSKINERFWAALFAHENHTIYEPFENRIYVYQPLRGLFISQHPESLREAIVQRIYELAHQRPRPNYLAATRFVSMQIIGGVIEALKGLTYQPNAFRRTLSDPIFLHTANTMLVYNEHQFHERPFSPEFHSRNQSPIPYDKNASQSAFRQAFFDNKFPQEDVALIQKYAGQCLLGRNLSQTILLLDGVAESSKTTLALAIADTIGRENCSELRTAQLGERFEISAFVGKSLLTAPDVKANFLSLYGASFLKSLVGSDLLSAEFKRSNRRVELEGTFNVIITSNSKLRVRLEGDSDAWKRRLLIVRFEYPIQSERIPDFHRVIVQNEGPGILNFLIEGSCLLLKNLSDCGKLPLNQTQLTRVYKFIAESDSLRLFLLANVCASSDTNSDLSTTEILDAYYSDCLNNDVNSLPTTEAQKHLAELMKDLFARSLSHSIKRNNKSSRGYSGVKFRLQNDENF